MAQASEPPPIPSNRPRTQYVPPPIPTNRPKSSYKPPALSSFLNKPTPTSSSGLVRPAPKPVLQAPSQPKTNNTNNSLVDQQWNTKPTVAQKPNFYHSQNNQSSEQSNSQPSSNGFYQTQTGHNNYSSGDPSHTSHNSQDNQDNMNSFKKGVGVTLDTTGAAKAFFKSDNRSKFMTKEQEKEAGSLAWGVSKNAAKNVTADDLSKATKAASNSSSSGQSASAAFASSLFSSQMKKDNKDLMTKDQQKQAAKLSWNVTKNVAKNVSVSDVKKASSFVSFSSSNQQQNNVQPAHRPAPTQPPTARSRPKPQPSQTNAMSGFAPPPNPTPRPQSGNFQGVPLQTSSQPKPATRNAPNLKPSFQEQANTGNKIKPTIIRPGAANRSVSPSPNSRGKMPPPRPSAGPSKKSSAPSRPGPAPGSRNNAGGLKPKRPAPKMPSAVERHGLSSISVTAPSTDENLPPRPGPGHQLYNKYMQSEPHAIAQFDYEAQEKDDLSFKADDVIVLVQKIDNDWYVGRCGNKQGMFPVQFVKIVVDITEGRKASVSSVKSTSSSASASSISGPRCVAKFEYTSDNWDDLTFPEGAVISLIERIDQDWLKGEYKGQSGIFPQSFVDVLEDLPVGVRRKTASSSLAEAAFATATYDFEAADGSELSFKEGNKIKITGKFNDDWLVGELNGRQGRFPSTFVDSVPANLPLSSPEDEPKAKSVEPHAFVQYDFVAEGDGELSLRSGETVVLLEKVGDDWFKGRYKGKEGIFPKNFVEVIVELPVSNNSVASKKTKSLGLGRANYEFVGETDDELSFKAGDEIALVEEFNADWMVGRLNGKEGRFPVGFVTILKSIPS